MGIRMRVLLSAPLAVALITVAFGCASPGRSIPPLKARAYEASMAGTEAFSRGDYAKALKKFYESLRINRSLDDRKDESIDLINIGRVYSSMGRPEDALKYLEEASTLSRGIGDRKTLSEAVATTARAEFQLNRFDGALKSIDESLEMDSGAGDKRAPSKLNLKAEILIGLGRGDEAEGVLKEALEAGRGGVPIERANTLRAIAGLKYNEEKFEEAEALLKEAYGIDASADTPGRTALDLEKLALVKLKKGDRAGAAFLLERSYKVSLSAGERERALSAIDVLVTLWKESGDGEKAGYYSALRERLANEGR